MSNEDILKESLNEANKICKWDTKTIGYYAMSQGIEKAISLSRADVLKKVEEISKIKNDKDMRIALIEFLYKNSPKELNSQQSDVKEDVGGSNPSKSSITEAVPQVSADSSNKKRATQK